MKNVYKSNPKFKILTVIILAVVFVVIVCAVKVVSNGSFSGYTENEEFPVNRKVVTIQPLYVSSEKYSTELAGMVYVFEDHTGMLVAQYSVDQFAQGGIVVYTPNTINYLNGVVNYPKTMPSVQRYGYTKGYIDLSHIELSEDKEYELSGKIEIGARGYEQIGDNVEGILALEFEIEDEAYEQGRLLIYAVCSDGYGECTIELPSGRDGVSIKNSDAGKAGYYDKYIASFNEKVIAMESLKVSSETLCAEMDGTVYVYDDSTGMIVVNYKADQSGNIVLSLPEGLDLIEGTAACWSGKDGLLESSSENIKVYSGTVSEAGSQVQMNGVENQSVVNGIAVFRFEIEDVLFEGENFSITAEVGGDKMDKSVECVLNLDDAE